MPQTLIVTPDEVASEDPSRWLTAAERTRCDASASARRRAERRAGRLAAKRLLWEAFGITPLAYEIGADGPAPCLVGWPGEPDVTISLSHSAGLGAASWAWTATEGTVGVDAQHIRPTHHGLAARALTPREQAQAAEVADGVLLLWALKEAAIKARRQAWGRAMREIMVTLDAPTDHGTARIRIAGEPAMAAWYERLGHWWIARAVRPVLRAPDSERPAATAW